MRATLLALVGAAIIHASMSARSQDAMTAAVKTTMTAANAQVAVQAFVDPEVVTPNGAVTITFTVTPARGVHVYAPGAEYQVIAVKLDPQTGLKPARVVYPPSEMYHFQPLDEHVPVYQKPFTLEQVVRVAPGAVKGKDTLKLAGRLDYQACSDRVCFKPESIPFAFELKVKR